MFSVEYLEKSNDVHNPCHVHLYIHEQSKIQTAHLCTTLLLQEPGWYIVAAWTRHNL